VSAANITAGDWFVTTDDAYPAEFAINTVIAGVTYNIALVHGGNPPNDLSIVANANVMSAAPELLKALRDLLAECRRHGSFPDVSFDFPTVKPAFDAAYAAILKSEGG
jgi:hypothetical protein